MVSGVWIVWPMNWDLQNGDKILAVNDKPVAYFEDLNAELLLGEKITLERNGQQQDITIPVNFIEKIVEKGKEYRTGASACSGIGCRSE